MTGRKGEKTRTDIVECAKRLFYEHGYDGTSFSDIVDASGLYRGNIYHYFKAKDDILLAVIDQHLGEFRALLEQWEKTCPEPRARLHAFVAMIAARRIELIQFGCPIGTLNSELGKDRRDLQETAAALFDLFRDWLAKCFGDLGYPEQAAELALHLLGRAQGITVLAQVYRDAAYLARETALLDSWIEQLEAHPATSNAP